MKHMIALWGRSLEEAVAHERGAKKFKDVQRENEYINVFGHDSSMLEIVLDRGVAPYVKSAYTRVVWSERNPLATPFVVKRYFTIDYPGKPKQAFYDDREWKPALRHAGEVETFILAPLLEPAATM